MEITISGDYASRETYAGNGGSNGLFLAVKGCAAGIRFRDVSEAYEIAGAILTGLYTEIEDWKSSLGGAPHA
jgi:hypothetical protein